MAKIDDTETQRDRDRRKLWCDIFLLLLGQRHNENHCVGMTNKLLDEFDKKFPAPKDDKPV